MTDKVSAVFCAVVGGIGLAMIVDWLFVAIISPELAALTLFAGCVLTFIGCIIEWSNELCAMKK